MTSVRTMSCTLCILLGTWFGLASPSLATDPSPTRFAGTLEQIDGKAAVKVKIGTQSEVLLLPEGPADLTKSLAPGDAIEGTYTQASGNNNAKTLQTVTLKSAGISALAAAGIMGLGIVGFLLIAMLILKVGEFKLRKLVIGADNRTSNSKTQAAIWFGIVIAAYIATLLARIWYGGWEYVGKIDIPQNLLILSGISAGTFAGAKLVTVNRVTSGLPKPTANAASPGDLFANDRGQFDLGDFQMFAWALLAAGVYVLQMVAFLKALSLSASVQLPDVDSTLLGFFGIGQGAYLTKKALGETQARVSGITPPETKPGDIVTISGSGFGEVTGYVRFGTALARVLSWQETSVRVEVPKGLRPGRFTVEVALTEEPLPSQTLLREFPLQPVPFTVL